MALKTIFIHNLKKYRKYRGISQMALAELCNTSTSYIGQIEIGNRFPSVEMIERIAEALQVRAYLLFFDDPDAEKATKPPLLKTGNIPDSVKDELVKRLTTAIRTVVKRIDS